jgi:hypothetical protein
MLDEGDDVGADVLPWPRSPLANLDEQGKVGADVLPLTPTKSENHFPARSSRPTPPPPSPRRRSQPRSRRDLSVEASRHTTPLAPQTLPLALTLDQTLPSNLLCWSQCCPSLPDTFFHRPPRDRKSTGAGEFSMQAPDKTNVGAACSACLLSTFDKDHGAEICPLSVFPPLPQNVSGRESN